MSFSANQATKVQKIPQHPHTLNANISLWDTGTVLLSQKFFFFGTKEPSPCPTCPRKYYLCILK